VLIAGFPAAAFGTNCYVVAPAAGEDCVVVDPGVGIGEDLDAVLAEHRLNPVAVLLTHGHLDHTFSVAPVCHARGVAAYVHPADVAMVADPELGMSRDMAAKFAGSGLTYATPDDVKTLDDAVPLSIAGLVITVDHAPGHTPGSVLFGLPGAGEEPRVVLSGDVLFAGSIGRTDLPGGDAVQMTRSLVGKILPMDDETVVLPGHGPATTIGRERVGNPFLRAAAVAAADEPGGDA
jgi:glyoxylase-like metal-dependent hydrolase (beta-lactamase superfamily II)